MKGITFDFNDIDKRVSIVVDPLLCDPKKVEIKTIKKHFKRSEFGQHLLDEEALISAVSSATNRIKQESAQEVRSPIASQVDAKLLIDTDADSMKVNATIIGAYGGQLLTVSEIFERLHLVGITRGISRKRITSLVKLANRSEPGESVSDYIAKGLPPRKGKDSRVIPLVGNAADRILKPQFLNKHQVDMRDLGDIISVDEGQEVAKILPPHRGRDGFDVYNKIIKAKDGDKLNVILGVNTEYSDEDDSIIIASVGGQPKFENGVMHVEDVYTVNGVNVKTGNIDYNGAVVVNGDVTESMKIIATGDVTINGFVESAYIKTDGNIVITEGIVGKPDTDTCELIASGSIAVSHAQHVKITTEQDLKVSIQLSHSQVKCSGNVIVGSSENSIDGSLFGCVIEAGKSISAGKIGAVSGSKLEIDYSAAISQFTEKLDSVVNLRAQVEVANAEHQAKLMKIKKYCNQDSLLDNLNELDEAITEQRNLLNWVRDIENEFNQQLDEFRKEAEIYAHEQLFAGVTVQYGEEAAEVGKTLGPSIVSFRHGRLSIRPFKN